MPNSVRPVLLAGALLLAAATTVDAGQIALVKAGRPRAEVIIPADADAQTRAAAGLLRRYVNEATGADLAVFDEGHAEDAEGLNRIHVGPTSLAGRLKADLDRLDGDGFLIHADGQCVVIVGPTPWGTEFGVCEFLERFVGVRWLMPGKDGADVPRRDSLAAPLEPGRTVRVEPAFFSRQLSGLRGPAMTEWGRRNRLHGRLQFHHNLHRVVPPKTYATAHPEFFPVRNGERFVPPPGEEAHWQPCFTAKGLVEEAATNIIAYFDAHPDADSFSLGVNDSSGHCECEACLALDPEAPNFLGRRHVSDRYFAWCNQVVERVLARHPGKRFGCLAYSEVAQAPECVKVHPAIVPFMTYDRMKWVKPDLREAGRAATRAWAAACPTLGWYDYIYGTPYCLPRVYFHEQAECVRWGHKAGVRAWYAEAYANWGEGPKLYVLTRLLWDPSQDVDAILDDWYRRAVGPEAAPLLAEYYAHWEDFWTRRAPESAWWSDRGQYLPFMRPDYLEAVDEKEIADSRRLLEAVVAKAHTPRQKARARLLLRAFEYYEATAMAYLAEVRPAVVPTTEAEAAAALARATDALAMADKRRRLALDEFPRDPVLMHPSTIDGKHGRWLSGEGWGTAALWGLFGWVQAHPGDAVRSRLEDLAGKAASASVREHAGLMLRLAEGQGADGAGGVAKNPSFEAGRGANADGWGRWVKNGVGAMPRAAEAARTGQAGIRCTGVARGGPHQTVAVAPGRYAAVAFVRCPKALADGATVSVGVIPRDAADKNLGTGFRTEVRPPAGAWHALAVAGDVPAEVAGTKVAGVLLIVTVDGLAAGDMVDIDDVRLYRLDD